MNLKDQKPPEPLPIGKYTGTIKNTEVLESKRGTMYCAVHFHIPAEQYPVDYTDGNPDGTTIVYRRVGLEDTPQSRYGTKRFIEAIGAPLAKKIDVSEWLGMEAALEVEHDVWEGVNRANIARVHPA